MTKEEAIQILSTRDAHGVMCGYTSGATEALDMAIEALSAEVVHKPDYSYEADMVKRMKEASLAKANRLIGEWIPVSERLPEEHEWIGTKRFGTTISDEVHITFDVNGERFVKTLSLQNGELSDYEKRNMDAFYKGWKMLAWMPLPQPYKGGGDE